MGLLQRAAATRAWSGFARQWHDDGFARHAEINGLPPAVSFLRRVFHRAIWFSVPRQLEFHFFSREYFSSAYDGVRFCLHAVEMSDDAALFTTRSV